MRYKNRDSEGKGDKNAQENFTEKGISFQQEEREKIMFHLFYTLVVNSSYKGKEKT